MRIFATNWLDDQILSSSSLSPDCHWCQILKNSCKAFLRRPLHEHQTFENMMPFGHDCRPAEALKHHHNSACLQLSISVVSSMMCKVKGNENKTFSNMTLVNYMHGAVNCS